MVGAQYGNLSAQDGNLNAQDSNLSAQDDRVAHIMKKPPGLTTGA